MVAYVRDRLEAGEHPAIARLRSALERLSRCESQPQADYGRRQLALLERVAPSDHAGQPALS